MFGGHAPEFLSHPFGFQMAVRPVGEFGPIQREALFHHLCGKIGAIWQVTFGDQPVIACAFVQLRRDDVAFAQGHHGELGLSAPGLIHLGGVDACKSDMGAVDDDGVAVDDIAPALQFSQAGGLYGVWWGGLRLRRQRGAGMDGARPFRSGRGWCGFTAGRREEFAQK